MVEIYLKDIKNVKDSTIQDLRGARGGQGLGSEPVQEETGHGFDAHNATGWAMSVSTAQSAASGGAGDTRVPSRSRGSCRKASCWTPVLKCQKEQDL